MASRDNEPITDTAMMRMLSEKSELYARRINPNAKYESKSRIPNALIFFARLSESVARYITSEMIRHILISAITADTAAIMMNTPPNASQNLDMKLYIAGAVIHNMVITTASDKTALPVLINLVFI